MAEAARMDDDVRDYISGIAAEQRPLFDRLHNLIVEVFPDVSVVLSYKMPTYVVGGRRLHVGVWKHGLSLYGWEHGRDGGFATRHPELDSGKGTLRLPRDNDIEDNELRDLVRATLAS